MRTLDRAPRRWPLQILMGFFMLPALVQAGAWTPKEGSAYHKFAINSYSTGSWFDPPPAPGFEKFTDRNFTYYLEYGISDTLTFFGSLPVKRLTSDSTGGTATNNGVGDIDLGLRKRFFSDGTSVFSGSLLFKAPYAYSKDDAVPLGNGQEDLEARLLFGRSLGRYGYVGLEGGYRFRNSAPSDEWRYLIEYGFDATEQIYLRTKLDGIVSAKNGQKSEAIGGNPTLSLEFDLAKLEATAGVRLSKTLAGEFSVTRDVYGSNTLRGTNYSLALIWAY